VNTQRPPPEAVPIVCDVGALVHPDVGVVDSLARLHLVAKRLGYRLELLDTPQGLRDMLDLVGVRSVLGVEPRRQAEEREEAPGVEEEGDPAEPMA